MMTVGESVVTGMYVSVLGADRAGNQDSATSKLFG